MCNDATIDAALLLPNQTAIITKGNYSWVYAPYGKKPISPGRLFNETWEPGLYGDLSGAFFSKHTGYLVLLHGVHRYWQYDLNGNMKTIDTPRAWPTTLVDVVSLKNGALRLLYEKGQVIEFPDNVQHSFDIASARKSVACLSNYNRNEFAFYPGTQCPKKDPDFTGKPLTELIEITAASEVPDDFGSSESMILFGRDDNYCIISRGFSNERQEWLRCELRSTTDLLGCSQVTTLKSTVQTTTSSTTSKAITTTTIKIEPSPTTSRTTPKPVSTATEPSVGISLLIIILLSVLAGLILLLCCIVALVIFYKALQRKPAWKAKNVTLVPSEREFE